MKNKTETFKTVVCGTAFGIFYIEAIKRAFPDFELAGIVANGSERSIKCAQNYNTRLYRSAEDIPDDIDLACVAVRSSSLGGAGTDLSVGFLKRGISVILEQPVHQNDLQLCFKTAQKNGCRFMVGDLYLNMPEVRRFLNVCEYMRSIGQYPEYITAKSSVQAFYPFVDILGKIIPDGEVEVKSVGEQFGSFKEIMCGIGQVPLSIQYNNKMNPKDPDNHMQVLHSFCCYYPTGRLELVDTRGPLIWYPRMNMPWSVLDEGRLPDVYPKHMYDASVQILTRDLSTIAKPYYKYAEDSWVDSITRDLMEIRSLTFDRRRFIMKSQQEQKSAKLWNELSQIFGFAALDSSLKPEPADLSGIFDASILSGEE